MASTPPPPSSSAWAPRSVADWLPLLLSCIVILGLLVALLLKRDAEPLDPSQVQEKPEATPPAVVTPELRTSASNVLKGTVGTVRLVATDALPRQRGPLANDPGCPWATLANASPQATAALDAGWHVGADLFQSGYQIVLVDAGIERLAQSCVPIGASVLVFVRSGLVAIVYDRGGKGASKLAAIRSQGTSNIQLSSEAGPLAALVLEGDEIRLR